MTFSFKVLDPRLKLEYYNTHRQDKRWINVSKDIIKKKYKEKYALSLPEEDDNLYNKDDEEDTLYKYLYKDQ